MRKIAAEKVFHLTRRFWQLKSLIPQTHASALMIEALTLPSESLMSCIEGIDEMKDCQSAKKRSCHQEHQQLGEHKY